MISFGYTLIILGFCTLFPLLSMPLYGDNGKGTTQERGIYVFRGTVLLTIANIVCTTAGFGLLVTAAANTPKILNVVAVLLAILLIATPSMLLGGLTFKTLYLIKTNYKEQKWTTFQLATIINQQFTKNFLFRLGRTWFWLAYLAAFFVGGTAITDNGKRYLGNFWLTISTWIYLVVGLLLFVRLGHFFRIWVWHLLKRAQVIENIPPGQTNYKVWKKNHQVGFYSDGKHTFPDGEKNRIDARLEEDDSRTDSSLDGSCASIESEDNQNVEKQEKEK